MLKNYVDNKQLEISDTGFILPFTLFCVNQLFLRNLYEE